jgi:hypothetical protein
MSCGTPLSVVNWASCQRSASSGDREVSAACDKNGLETRLRHDGRAGGCRWLVQRGAAAAITETIGGKKQTAAKRKIKEKKRKKEGAGNIGRLGCSDISRPNAAVAQTSSCRSDCWTTARSDCQHSGGGELKPARSFADGPNRLEPVAGCRLPVAYEALDASPGGNVRTSERRMGRLTLKHSAPVLSGSPH